jgi:hypothetical protein
VNEGETADLRKELRAQHNGARPIIERGEGFERMLRGEVKPWIRTV